MTRMLYILGILIIFAAGCVFTLCVLQWSQNEAESPVVLTARGTIETFMQNRDRYPQDARGRTSPLVVQAQAFASYLNPARSEKDIASATLRFASRSSLSSVPAVRPLAPTIRFKLHGTSCCPNQPERSMALIWEPAGIEGTTRWVKEGTRLGHFVVHEIRRGVVVIQDGEQLRELSIERSRPSRSLVRDTQADTRHVNAAINDGRVLPLAPGPNSIDIGIPDRAATD